MPAKKQITKEMILNAALRILQEQGYEAVNIKRLATALGCSTQPVYLSFSGMDELRSALTPLTVAEFEAYMQRSGASSLYDMPYIQLAKEEPRLFCFLFMRANAFAEIRQALVPMIERSIAALMAAYHISHAEADWLHDQLWMHAHGIAAMIATNFCDWNMEKAQAMLAESSRAFTGKYEA